MKKHFILISFLLCLIAPAMVTYLWLHYQKKQVKHEVKWKMIEGINKSELVLIQLSRAEAEDKIEWEHSKEFEFEGHMYDVVEFESTADSLKYWCWWDHEETLLNRNLAKLVKQVLGDHPDKKEKEQQLISFYKSLFSEKAFVWHAIHFELTDNPKTIYQLNLNSYSRNIPTPPPQFAV